MAVFDDGGLLEVSDLVLWFHKLVGELLLALTQLQRHVYHSFGLLTN